MWMRKATREADLKNHFQLAASAETWIAPTRDILRARAEHPDEK